MSRTKVLIAALLFTLAGCSGKAKVEAKAPPPPPADADGDGVSDDVDKCVGEKEDGKAPDPNDGCASKDSDEDGILDDGTDKCIGQKEDNLPPDPKDGCLTTDPDGDGIAGNKDKCPTEPETKNGHDDEDGCPDKIPRVQVTKGEVKVNEKILFAFGKATIDDKSNDLLDDIAGVVLDNPQIEFVEVAGHADKIGTDPLNVNLTRQRAQAVQNALVTRGVSFGRMRAIGYGRYCPLDKGESEEAREKNRRVEFKILRVDGVETGVQLGCEEAASKGIKPAGVPKTAPTRALNEKAQPAAKEKLAKLVAEHKAAEEKEAKEAKEAKDATKPAAATAATKPAAKKPVAKPPTGGKPNGGSAKKPAAPATKAPTTPAKAATPAPAKAPTQAATAKAPPPPPPAPPTGALGPMTPPTKK